MLRKLIIKIHCLTQIGGTFFGFSLILGRSAHECIKHSSDRRRRLCVGIVERTVVLGILGILVADRINHVVAGDEVKDHYS